MTFDTAGRSMMGIKPGDYSDFAAEMELQGFGANCGIGPAELIDSVSYFDSRQQDRFVIAKGNCGIPAYVDGEIRYHGTPELMAEYAVIARDWGRVLLADVAVQALNIYALCARHSIASKITSPHQRRN